MADNGNGNGGKLRGAADNIWAIIVARFVLPLAVVIVGSVGTIALNSLVNNSQAVWVKLTELHEDLSGLHVYLRDITASRDRELSQINSRLADQENRLRDVEGKLDRHR